MYGIDSLNSVTPIPAPAALGTVGFFEDGLSGGSPPGTPVDGDWANMVQESWLDLLDDQSIAHSKTDFGGITLAIASKIFNEKPTVPIASETVAGLVEIAEFPSEIQTSPAAAPKILHPRGVDQLFTKLSVTRGYVIWPTISGGQWLFQWTTGTTNDGSLFTLPRGFSSTSWIGWAHINKAKSGSHPRDVRVVPASSTQYVLHVDAAETPPPLPYSLFAIGER
ncbi:MAG: hypothetical protein V3S03_08430 [Vicinamibacteria bacterium]